MEKIAVLIPCFNEELTIKKVVNDFKKELPDADIYVYNNNSKDSTVENAKNAGAIVRDEYKQGKGNVVRTMFRDVDADIYIMVDGDDTYPAEAVHELIAPIKKGQADMVVGDRISNGTYKKENKRIFHKFGNKLVKYTINKLFKSNLKDIMSGYRAFNKMFIKNMPVMSPKFEVETEMTLHALENKFIIKEIPILYRDRIKGSKSKLNTVRDGTKVIKTILSMLKDYKPRKFFWTISIFFTVIGVVIGMPVLIEFIKTKYVTKVPSAILATGIEILALIIAQCGVILDTVTKQNMENYELQLLRYKQIEDMKKMLNIK